MRLAQVHRRTLIGAGVAGMTLLCAACVRAGAGAPAVSVAPALTQQWLALRIQKGHFDGAAWNDAVDRWQGAKHQLMQQLGALALQQRLDAAGVVALLGAPDQRQAAGAEAHAQVLQQAQWLGEPAGAASELWLYRWRGTHDQLVLALVAGRVQAVGWWMAFE